MTRKTTFLFRCCGAVALALSAVLCSCTPVGRLRYVAQASGGSSRHTVILACSRPGRPPWVAVISNQYVKGDTKKPLTETEFETLWNGLQAEHLEKFERLKGKVPSSITNDNYLLMSGETWSMTSIPSGPMYVVPKAKASASLKAAAAKIAGLYQPVRPT
jgi:hypothetical protein